MVGLTIKETAKELVKSTRTVFRMINDGRLKAERVTMPYGKYIWIVDPISVARVQVRKELKEEEKNNRNIRNRTR